MSSKEGAMVTLCVPTQISSSLIVLVMLITPMCHPRDEVEGAGSWGGSPCCSPQSEFSTDLMVLRALGRSSFIHSPSSRIVEKVPCFPFNFYHDCKFPDTYPAV